jgi:hypothetical protein
LNLYINHRTEKQTVPSIIFGSTQDLTRIIPSKLTHPQIFKYLSMNSNEDNYKTIKSESIALLKKWYCRESKNFLSKILDIYQKESKCFNKYANIVNIDNQHWIYVEVNLEHSIEENCFGHIKTIHSMTNSDKKKTTFFTKMCASHDHTQNTCKKWVFHSIIPTLRQVNIGVIGLSEIWKIRY